MRRKLATLLFADVAGYSLLMDADEQQTTIEIEEVFSSILGPAIQTGGGRIVHQAGDGFFSEFDNVQAAVTFAVELQNAMAEYNRHKEPHRMIQFRIGINYGDVIFEDKSCLLTGTAVNIAARLENIADVGGIWVSERVVKEFGQHPLIRFHALGSRRLKNIAGRVSVFGVTQGDLLEEISEGYSRSQFRALNASVAVLPFRVISDHPEGEKILSEAIAEDLMTELGRFTEISIVSLDPTADYPGQVYQFKEIGRRFGVDYVITGSVSRNAGEIRVHARLLETERGEQLWSKRYDASLNEIFVLQNEVARDLASTLPLRIEDALLTGSYQKPIESLDAYDSYLRGRALYREKTEASDREAIALLERAIELDPDFADPYAVLGAIHGINWAYSSWGIDPLDRILAGRALIEKALSLNPNLPRAHAHLAWTYLSTKEFERVRDCFDTAVSLNPNDLDVLLLKAYAILYMGEPQESVRICKVLMELNPRFPEWYIDVLGGAQFVAGNYQDALGSLMRVEDLFPESTGWIAACLANLGRIDDAKLWAELFIEHTRKIWKGSSKSGPAEYIEWFLHNACPFMLETDRFKLADGLRKSGLPVSDAHRD